MGSRWWPREWLTECAAAAAAAAAACQVACLGCPSALKFLGAWQCLAAFSVRRTSLRLGSALNLAHDAAYGSLRSAGAAAQVMAGLQLCVQGCNHNAWRDWALPDQRPVQGWSQWRTGRLIPPACLAGSSCGNACTAAGPSCKLPCPCTCLNGLLLLVGSACSSSTQHSPDVLSPALHKACLTECQQHRPQCPLPLS